QGGNFQLQTDAGRIIVRAPGYRPLMASTAVPLHLALEPFVPKALYLSFWGADSRRKRQQIRDLLVSTQVNALVIDIKSSRGHIAYRSNIPLARQIGAQQVRPLKDLPEFLGELKAQGIYTIARMVVFKDDLLAKNRPEFAVQTEDGEIWEDREKLSWSDPFNPQVQEYNLAVAEEAAQLGFDEVQFDYIRFPATSDLRFSQESSDESRVAAINGFLGKAKERLAPYPVFTSANIFGYICWKHRDGKIGQRLVDLGDRVDYLSPMLYPSGFPNGIPAYSDPVSHPYEVIAHSLQRARQLSGLAAIRFRPWLQSFRDYAFDRRRFTAVEVHAQINASDASGSHGWMLWNAASRFSLASLQQELPPGELKLADTAPTAEEPTMLTRTEQDLSTPPL
ncbi:MAG: putative glycoside hydrolase, partial [Desulfuromonadales bacterium]|nr:putative glycoside hydrolase [Desulfuromonadales bacterium]